MRTLSSNVYILAAKRTAFGTFGGALKDLSATDLGVVAAKAAMTAAGTEAKDFDQVIFGNVMQTSVDAIYLARHVGLKAGLPEAVPGLTVNRLCGSGFQAIINGVEQILLGQGHLMMVGGAESMSQSPHIIRGARWGLPLGKSEMEDSLWTALNDTYVNMPMAITAENLAVQYKISQDEVDAYSVRSQKRFAEAQAQGRFDAEMAPVPVTRKKETISFAKDEHNRPDTTADNFKKLPKVFKKDGVIHAGAASGICDGAGALVLASEKYVKEHGSKPLARIVGWGFSGCDPKIMGIGPVPAIQRALAMTESRLQDYQLVDVNEAFAPQVLAVQKELGIPDDTYNVNGGAIAVGHPLAASGARITAHLVHELRRRGNKYGMGAACIGGGQGIALAIEAMG